MVQIIEIILCVIGLCDKISLHTLSFWLLVCVLVQIFCQVVSEILKKYR